MIGRLRKKFLLAAMTAVFLVLFILIGAMNVLNYRSLVAEADGTLDILSSNKGFFPRQMFREQDRPGFGGEPGDAAGEPSPPQDEGRREQGDFRRGDGELAYQSRYCTVWFDSDGNVTAVNLDNLASLTEDEASSLGTEIYKTGKLKGFSGEYRYRRTLCDGETMLLLLNCGRELSTFRSFLYASVGISLGGFIAVFLLLLLFSGRIVSPIAESYEKQKRFITDAGHELKTPITIIRADADVLESELGEENEWIEDIRKQTHRLGDLTEELIYLSKMEEGNSALQLQELSLSELTEETARSFQSIARSHDKSFSCSIAQDVSVNGDEKALAKLVSILLDNAMKYSPEGASVALRLERQGRCARLCVKNDAQDIEKGSADRLFERFARADSSRNSQSGGFGLGLAIAKAVAETHRGRIHAESEDGRSLTVTVELPLA